MKEDTIGWVILLTMLVALGIASVTSYLWIDEIIRGYFFS
jgi:hypothetical protein